MPGQSTRAATLGLVLVLALAAAGTASAAAVRPPSLVPASLTAEVSDARFVVHYDPAVTTAQQASDVLGMGAVAYQREVVEAGLPAPPDDGDGRTDVYLYAPPGGLAGLAGGDAGGDHTSGWLALRPDIASPRIFGHEYMHLIQFGLYAPEAADHWLAEGTAEWAGSQVAGSGSNIGLYEHPETSLDCHGAAPDGPDCAGDSFGYGRWVFYEFLTERFGVQIVSAIYAADAALGASDHLPHGLAAIDAALRDRGSSLADAFQRFTEAAVAGDFTLRGAAGVTPEADLVPTGAQSGALATVTVTPGHLGAAYVEYHGPPGSPCDAAILHLDVTMPAGLASQPVFDAYGDGLPPYRLAHSGGHATADIPWRACAAADGKLALPNPSLDDGKAFTVQASQTVMAQSQPLVAFSALSGVRFRGVKLAVAKVMVHAKGMIRPRLTCPAAAAGPCTGTLTLSTRVAARSATSARASTPIRLGSTRFKIRRGATAVVRVKLTAAAMKRLRKGRTLRARAVALASDDGGRTKMATSRMLMVRAPRKTAPRRVAPDG